MFKITNNNEKDFIGRYDGVDFTFPVATPVYCEDEAAHHIFGIGLTDKTPILSRHGWAPLRADSSYQAGMKILNAFAFEHIETKLDAPLARSLTGHEPALVGQDAAANGSDGPKAAAGAAPGVAPAPKVERPPKPKPAWEID